MNLKALKIHEEANNTERIAVTLGNVSNAYDDYGDLVKSLEYKQRALELMLQQGMMLDAARVYVTLGSTHRQLGNTEAALEAFNRGLSIYEASSDDVSMAGVAYATGSIANIFNSVGDHSTSLEYYFRSLELFEKIGAVADYGRTIGNIGRVYFDIGDAATAIEKYQYALDTAVKLGDRRLQVYWQEAIGVALWQQGQWNEALSYFYAALEQYEQLEHMQENVNIRLNIVKATIDAGDIHEARRLFANIDETLVTKPHVQILHLLTQAELLMLDEDLAGSKLTYEKALNLASNLSHRRFEVRALKCLRNLALRERDLDAYVRYNEECQRLEQETQHGDAARRLALHEQKRAIDVERRQHERERTILDSTLPKHIADRVVRGEQVNDHFDNAAVIFLDIVGFTTISNQLSSDNVVRLLEQVFTTLDTVCERHDVVKIKTIGDSYMAVAFGEYPNSRITEYPNSNCAIRAAHAALDMLSAIADLPESLRATLPESLRATLPESLRETLPTGLPSGLQVRIGLHSGPVTAGVIGTTRMQYDVWGDTVNVASRIEGTSIPGRIHVSEAFAFALHSETAKGRNSETAKGRNSETDVIPSVSEEPGTWHLELRGETELKGKGTMTTYWLERT